MKVICVFIFLLLAAGTDLFGQSKFPVFQIARRPPIIPQSTIDSINRAISNRKEIGEVLDLISHRLRRFTNTEVLIYQNNNFANDTRIWLPIGYPSKMRIDMRGKKAVRSDEAVHTLQQFRTFFTDTLYIIDTLKVKVTFDGESLPINNYFISLKVKGEQIKISLTNAGNGWLEIHKLSYLKELFDSGYLDCSLYNTRSPQQLASFRLRFLNIEQIMMLKTQLSIIRTLNDGSIDLNASAKYLKDFLRVSFGEMKTESLISWIKNQ